MVSNSLGKATIREGISLAMLILGSGMIFQ